MVYSRYLISLLVGSVTVSSLSAAPTRVLEHTGTIYKNIKENTEMKVEAKDPAVKKRKKKRMILNQVQTVIVRGFKIIGNDEFSQAEIDKVLTPFIGRKMSIDALPQTANALTEYYHDKGFFNANVALIAPYILEDGIIVLVVDERHLEEGGISVENKGERIKSEKVQRLWDNIMKPGAMKQEAFERAILLTNDLPGVSATADLYYGTDENTDDLVITVEDTDVFNGNIDIEAPTTPERRKQERHSTGTRLQVTERRSSHVSLRRVSIPTTATLRWKCLCMTMPCVLVLRLIILTTSSSIRSRVRAVTVRHGMLMFL